MVIAKHTDWRPSTIRSIADSIEVVFPSAADELRGIARSLEPPPRPEDFCGKPRQHFPQHTCELEPGHLGDHENATHEWEKY